MSRYLWMILLAMVLVVATASLAYETPKEPFASKRAPESNLASFKEHDKACQQSMDRCNTPFCINLKTGTGPLLDCAKEYIAYASKKDGLIPTYQTGDWAMFSF